MSTFNYNLNSKHILQSSTTVKTDSSNNTVVTTTEVAAINLPSNFSSFENNFKQLSFNNNGTLFDYNSAYGGNYSSASNPFQNAGLAGAFANLQETLSNIASTSSAFNFTGVTDSITVPNISSTVAEVSDSNVKKSVSKGNGVSVNVKNYKPLVIKILKEQGLTDIDPDLILAIIDAESSGNPNAKSGCGAIGLMQLMPGTAKEMGVTNPYDVEDNLRGGIKYFASIYHKLGNVQLALAGYNAGPNRKSLKQGRIPNIPETQNYVAKITQNYNNMKSKN